MRRALSAIILSLILSHIASAQVSININKNALVSRDETGRELWRISHASVKNLVPSDKAIDINGKLYYATGVSLLEVDPKAGMVTRRFAMPGRIAELTLKDKNLTISFNVPKGEAIQKNKIIFNLENPQRAYLPLGDISLVEESYKDARALISTRGRIFKTGDEARSVIASGKLQEAFRRNPTNPWFMYFVGKAQTIAGNSSRASNAFLQAVATENAPAYEFLRLSAYLAIEGHLSESDIAFERGFSETIQSGVEPELVLSQNAFIKLYAAIPPNTNGETTHAQAIKEAIATGDSSTLVSLTERVWRLAPHLNGATSYFAGLAEFLQKNGRAAEASIWFSRARNASRLEGPAGARQSFEAGLGCAIAALILLISILYKAFAPQRKLLAAYGGIIGSWKTPGFRLKHLSFAYATRRELTGIIIMSLASLSFSIFALQSGKTRLGSLPEELGSGTWAYPSSVEIFDEFDDTNRKALLHYAIARHQEGGHSLVLAKENYRGLVTSENPEIASVANNNLGVIERISELFEKSLAADSNLKEAAFNLGQKADSVRINRARRYMPNNRLIALPSADMLRGVLAKARDKSSSFDPAVVLGPLGFLLTPTIFFAGMMFLLATVYLFIRVRYVRPARKALSAMSYILPGASGRLAPWGGLLLAVWLYCLMIVLTLVRNAYYPQVSAKLQEIVKVFGLAGEYVFPFQTLLAVFGPVVFIGIWVANLLMLARHNRRARNEARKMHDGATVPLVVEGVKPDELKDDAEIPTPEEMMPLEDDADNASKDTMDEQTDNAPPLTKDEATTKDDKKDNTAENKSEDSQPKNDKPSKNKPQETTPKPMTAPSAQAPDEEPKAEAANSENSDKNSDENNSNAADAPEDSSNMPT